MEIKVNINEEIKVKLTDEGKIVYAKWDHKHDDVIHKDNLMYNSHLKNDDFWEFHLWELMQIFGEEMRMGNKSMFVKNEIIFGV